MISALGFYEDLTGYRLAEFLSGIRARRKCDALCQIGTVAAIKG